MPRSWRDGDFIVVDVWQRPPLPIMAGELPRNALAARRRAEERTSSRSRRHGQSETNVASAQVQAGSMAPGRAQATRTIEPGTAAQNPHCATRGCLARAAISGCSIVVLMPAVLHPLPDVAVHLVKTPRIWGEAVHWHGPLTPWAYAA